VKRVITEYRLNLYMPLESVKKNMDLAHAGNAVTTQKFLFRTDLSSSDEPHSGPQLAELTVDEIINGSDKRAGLLHLVRKYVSSAADNETKQSLEPYLELIQRRASGESWTASRWMRDFVRSHPQYQQDSFVSSAICHDLMLTIENLTKGIDREKCQLFS
jgi:glutamate--cysteine ligase catalytic subunit